MTLSLENNAFSCLRAKRLVFFFDTPDRNIDFRYSPGIWLIRVTTVPPARYLLLHGSFLTGNTSSNLARSFSSAHNLLFLDEDETFHEPSFDGVFFACFSLLKRSYITVLPLMKPPNYKMPLSCLRRAVFCFYQTSGYHFTRINYSILCPDII